MERTLKARIILRQRFGNADGGDAGSRWYTSEPVTISFDEPSGHAWSHAYEVVGAEIERDRCYICGQVVDDERWVERDGRFYHQVCKYPKVK
jgi:hypothetical protein